MTVLAYIHILSSVLFFVGLITRMREKDESEKEAMWATTFALLVLMVVSGLGLAMGELGLLPTIHW